MTGDTRDPLAATLYTRHDCPLCFALKRLAERAARRHGVPLVVVDIDSDSDLRARYTDQVPVLLLPGGVAVAGRAEPRAVDTVFADAARLIRERSADARRSPFPSPRAHGRLARFRRALDRIVRSTSG